MAGRKTQALAWCAALLLLAEVGLRALDAGSGPEAPVVTDKPLALALGTSRTRRAIDPDVVRAVLVEDGQPSAFTANVSFKAVTNVGLLRNWIEKVAPRLPRGARGVVAIEARCEGFNDNYLLDDERAWLQSGGMSGDADGRAETLPQQPLTADAISGALLRRLHLFELAESLPAFASEDADDDWNAEVPGSTRGFRPFEGEPRLKDLNRAYWENHYRSRLLKDFAFGGVQTEAIVRLIAEIRSAGLVPALYIMPITDVQRGFFEGNGYAEVRAHVMALAGREGVPLSDLDSARQWPQRLFHDTNHMTPESSGAVSKLFTRKVMVPLLGEAIAPR